MTPQVTYSLREIDGGPNYYSQFINSLPSDPNFFPIGVWFESVTSQSDINLDKAAGLNTYVVITSNSNFNLIQSNGMYLIAQQDQLANNATVQATAEGLIIADEIDMTQGPGTGYATLESRISGLPAAWDNHLLYNNYGKGVMFWETDAQAARFVNGTASFGPYQHIVSADTYWFTDPNIDGGSEGGRLLNNGQPLTYDQTRLAANYGYTVDRMRYLDSLDGVLQPVWNFVEVGWPFTETAAQGARAIEPEEIQAAVWHSLIAGARGIVYFNHSFGGPDQTQHALRDPDYAEERAAVTETNALIQQLAPVLNSPFDDGFVSVNSSVRAAAQYYQGEHYVFAGATINGAATAPDTFTLAGITNGTAIVINENRSIPIVNGQFSDTFADGNAIHIYQIDTGGIPTPTSGLGLDQRRHDQRGQQRHEGGDLHGHTQRRHGGVRRELRHLERDRHCRRRRLCGGLQHAAFRSQPEHADDLGHDQRRHQGRGERDLQRRSVKCDQRRHHQRQSRCRHHHQR